MEEQTKRNQDMPLSSPWPFVSDTQDSGKEEFAESQEGNAHNVAPVQQSTLDNVSPLNDEGSKPLPIAPPMEETLAQIEQGVCQSNTTMAQLLTEFQELEQQFDAKIRFDQSREKMIDALHTELQSYRDDFAFRLIRPLINTLISLHDDLGHVLNFQEPDENPVKAAGRLRQSMSVLQDVIESALEQEGVQSFQEESGLFNAQCQRPVTLEPTNDPELDKHISRRLKKGFSYKQRILRPENVAVYKFIPVSTGDQNTTENSRR